ncbi:MAG: hypothetical protein HY764_04755 [Candidatus Portnoybacteria bacterium]|nr:hypothetical protein [Candidatus Portnoybacteria bacterium]
MKNKTILIAVIVLILIAIGGFYYYFSNKASQPPVELQDGLDRQRQDCIDKYGTKEDPLGLSDNADPRLAECLKQVDPKNPLGI